MSSTRRAGLSPPTLPGAATRRAADAFDHCARSARAAFGDLAPALRLLPPGERHRAEVLCGCVVELVGLADRDRGERPDGGHRAAIDRWQAALRSALLGEQTRRPELVALSLEQRRRPFPPGALAEVVGAVRSWAERSRPLAAGEVSDAFRRIARGTVTALLGGPPPPGTAEFGAALLHLQALRGIGPWGDHRPTFPQPPEGPAARARRKAPTPEQRLTALHRQCEAIRPHLLGISRRLPDLAPAFRPAALFLLLAALHLSTRIEHGGVEILERPPELHLRARWTCIIQARRQARRIGQET